MVNSDYITSYMSLHELPNVASLSANDLFLISTVSALATDNTDAVTISQKISYKNLLEQIFSEASLDLFENMLDIISKYVTISTDQTIIGEKLFKQKVTSLNGLSIALQDNIYKSYSNIVKGITNTSADISNAVSALVTDPKSVKDYVSAYTDPLFDFVEKANDKYVTISTDQTIFGRKAFTNANGLSIALQDSIYSKKAGAVKGITYESADISNAVSALITSPKAVKDYISQTCLPIDALGDLTSLPDIVNALKSLITEEDIICYVDPKTIEDKDTQDGTFQHPFMTLPQAIALINRRRFIGNSQAYIRILNDYCVNTTIHDDDDVLDIYNENGEPNVIDIYHSDMVQNRFINIIGYSVNNDDKVIQATRTLSVDMSNITADNKYWFYCRCNVRFRYIDFSCGINFVYNQNTKSLSPTLYSSFCIEASKNVGSIELANCKIHNCYFGVEANNLVLTDANEFSYCLIPLNSSNPGIGRSAFTGSVYCHHCNIFARVNLNSTAYYSNIAQKRYTLIVVYNSAFMLINGGMLTLNIASDYTHDKNHCLWLAHYIGEDTSELITQSNNDNIDLSVLSCMFNRNSLGYGDDGYVSLIGSGALLSSYLSKNTYNIDLSDLNSVLSSVHGSESYNEFSSLLSASTN